jgi:hypothetical protein
MANSSNPMFFVTFGFSLLSGCSQAPSLQQRLLPMQTHTVDFCSGAARMHERSAETGSRFTCRALALKVERLRWSGVYISPPALMQCGMVNGLDQWLAQSVVPAARFYLRETLTEVESLGSFACKPLNGIVGSRISEHGSANAFELKALRFSTGSTLSIADGWHNQDPRVRIFMRSIHRSACRYFTTVLGPDADTRHTGHFHLDLAHREPIEPNSSNRICQ